MNHDEPTMDCWLNSVGAPNAPATMAVLLADQHA